MSAERTRTSRVDPRRLSLLARFAVITLAMVTVMGVVLAVLLERSIRERTESDARRTAEAAAQLGMIPAFGPDDLTANFAPLAGDRTGAIARQLFQVGDGNQVVRIKVWNRQHWLVWSDNPGLVGRWFPGTPLLAEAFSGRIGSQVTDLSAPEELTEAAAFPSLLAVYVPIRQGTDGRLTTHGDGPVLGAFEIYLPYEPIAAAIRTDTRKLEVALALALSLLYLAVFRLVSGASHKLRRQSDQNLHQALHDSLTGLPNRTLFGDRVQQALAQAGREGTDVAVMIVDLDRFKEINDTLGHHRGDELLQQVGARLTGRLRGSDSVARLGGDEFALLLPRIHHPDDARLVALELHRMLEEPFDIAGIELDIHGSIGVAVSPHHGEDVGTLLQHADVAMYVAKAAHSRVEVYDASLDHYSPERLELAAEFRQAIDERQLVLFYQPKVDAITRRCVGVEALVRWQHPVRGLLGPGSFLPAIEHTELMRPMTEVVLEAAAHQAGLWRKQGWDVPVAVNLSARTVGDEGLPARIGRLLRTHGLPPHALELELTESAVLADPDRAARILGEVHKLGVHISIDDFGSGYASVAYLTQFPVDAVKIDQQFVTPMLQDHKAASIVRFTIDLGRNLELKVVAEGVETEDVAEALGAAGCDVLQGYGICRPAPAQNLTEFLTTYGMSLTEIFR